MQDLEKSKVRLRVSLARYSGSDSLCIVAVLAKNKLGREEVNFSLLPTLLPSRKALKDPMMWDTNDLVCRVIDIMGTLRPGEEKDMTLYPIEEGVFAASSTNALLAKQGRFKPRVTQGMVVNSGVEIRAYQISSSGAMVTCQAAPMRLMKNGGKWEVREDFASDFRPLIHADLAKVNAYPKVKMVPQLKIYPTAEPGEYALNATEAFLTFSSSEQ